MRKHEAPNQFRENAMQLPYQSSVFRLLRRDENVKDGKRNQLGYSLLEILVVLAIISALMAIVGPRVLGHVDQSKVVSTKTQAKNYFLKKKLERSNFLNKNSGEKLIFQPKLEREFNF